MNRNSGCQRWASWFRWDCRRPGRRQLRETSLQADNSRLGFRPCWSCAIGPHEAHQDAAAPLPSSGPCRNVPTTTEAADRSQGHAVPRSRYWASGYQAGRWRTPRASRCWQVALMRCWWPLARHERVQLCEGYRLAKLQPSRIVHSFLCPGRKRQRRPSTGPLTQATCRCDWNRR
jgi:hypothetical protein